MYAFETKKDLRNSVVVGRWPFQSLQGQAGRCSHEDKGGLGRVRAQEIRGTKELS